MKKYKLLTSGYADQLEKQVNEAISDGWEPLGGIGFSAFLRAGATATAFCQAMTKEEWDSFSFDQEDVKPD